MSNQHIRTHLIFEALEGPRQSSEIVLDSTELRRIQFRLLLGVHARRLLLLLLQLQQQRIPLLARELLLLLHLENFLLQLRPLVLGRPLLLSNLLQLLPRLLHLSLAVADASLQLVPLRAERLHLLVQSQGCGLGNRQVLLLLTPGLQLTLQGGQTYLGG